MTAAELVVRARTTTRSTRTRTPPTPGCATRRRSTATTTRGFWALSRHADVMAAFRDTVRFSSRPRRVARPGRVGPARPPDDVVPRHGPAACTAACAALVSRGFTPRRVAELEPRIRELTRAAPRRRARRRGHVRLHRRPRRQAADGRDLRADRRARGRPGRAAPPGRPARAPRGGRARRAAGRRGGRLHAGRATTPTCSPSAGAQPHRRPHLGAARRRGRRRPPHRRRDHRLPVPHGRRRQRDHHQAARPTPGTGRGATPTSGPSRSPTRAGSPTWIEETLRYDTSSQMLARVVTTEASSCTARRSRPATGCCCSSGSANRDERVFADADRYDLDRPTREPAIASFGFGRHFCLGRVAGPARGAGRASRSWSPRVADYDIDDGRRHAACTPSTSAASPPSPPR